MSTETDAEESFEVVVTVRMKSAEKQHVRPWRNAPGDLLKAHAVYVLDRTDRNPVVDVEVVGEIPGETSQNSD